MKSRIITASLIFLGLGFLAFLPAQNPPSNGNATKVNGASVPASQSCVGTNGSSQIVSGTCGGAPSGAAGGDLSGTYPNPGVAKVNGNTIPANASGALTNNGTGTLTWTPATNGITALTGDGTATGPGSSALTVTKTNGVSFATSATTDTTNAANISSGALPAGRMPALTGDCTTTAGAVATTCTKTNGVAFATSATTDTTSATNITSGSLPAGRMPALTGDCTTSAGAVATTCTKANGVAFATSATTDTTNATNITTGTLTSPRVQMYGMGTITAPPTTSWTQDNGGTFDTTNGYPYLLAARAAAINIRAVYRTSPATPYTCKVQIWHNINGAFDASSTGLSAGYGIAFGDGTGKYVGMMTQTTSGSSFQISTDKWTSSTSYSANYLTFGPFISVANFIHENPTWFYMTDDGTNLKFGYSLDWGNHLIQLDSRVRTDFLASGPTRNAFFAYSNGDGVAMAITSWACQ